MKLESIGLELTKIRVIGTAHPTILLRLALHHPPSTIHYPLIHENNRRNQRQN